MKRLLIAYGDQTIFDGDVSSFTWQDEEGSVVVSGKTKPTRAASSTGIFDMITAASRRQTEAKRAELAAVDAEEAS